MPNCFAPYDGSPCTCGTCDNDPFFADPIHCDPTEEDLADRQELEEYDEYLRQMADSIDIAETNFVTPVANSFNNHDDLPF